MKTSSITTLEELQETYRNDRFATQAAHCRIVEATADRVVCEMPIEDVHLNILHMLTYYFKTHPECLEA